MCVKKEGKTNSPYRRLLRARPIIMQCSSYNYSSNLRVEATLQGKFGLGRSLPAAALVWPSPVDQSTALAAHFFQAAEPQANLLSDSARQQQQRPSQSPQEQSFG